ncbi:CopD family protein [Ketobacter alkanivorans]|uniref:Copper resistance protein CopD n=1 Tax=Ketobacter alkanivorans TaxID=1917421 RepID=A0A2K9LQW2_9GAMM|nr:CopD family protein [Ketobacter alkanivorans]AUM14718.1 copper resistance protein CopD [Ketobacter alkanivorans]
MYGVLLFLHIIGATIWTGGHIVLSVVILPRSLRHRSPEILLDFEKVYEKIGMPALIIQIATGLALSYNMLPSVKGWFDLENPLTHALLLKFVLLLITFLFALHARFRVIPRLSPETLKLMAWHIVPVTIMSILFVFAGVSVRTGWLY